MVPVSKPSKLNKSSTLANSRVAIQGELGAFSEVAARQLLGPAPAIVPCEHFDDVFRALQSSEVEAAVIPLKTRARVCP